MVTRKQEIINYLNEKCSLILQGLRVPLWKINFCSWVLWLSELPRCKDRNPLWIPYDLTRWWIIEKINFNFTQYVEIAVCRGNLLQRNVISTWESCSLSEDFQSQNIAHLPCSITHHNSLLNKASSAKALNKRVEKVKKLVVV